MRKPKFRKGDVCLKITSCYLPTLNNPQGKCAVIVEIIKPHSYLFAGKYLYKGRYAEECIHDDGMAGFLESDLYYLGRL